MLTPQAAVIGAARMQADGTIVLELRNPWMRREIPRTSPEHEGIVAHVGGLEPGQLKPVPPWPDDINDEAVEESLRSYVRAKGLSPDECAASIEGTDREGRIRVSVVCGVRHFSLRLRPNTYQVLED